MTPDEAEPSPRFTAGLMKMRPAKKPTTHSSVHREERLVPSTGDLMGQGERSLGQDSPGLRACVRVTVMLMMVAPMPALFGCFVVLCRNGVSLIGTKTKEKERVAHWN